jgi:hypothetical protein
MSPRSLAAAALLLVAALPAHAGPHSDALAKCLVASTNPEDRVALVRWMFAAFAAHPSVAPMSSVTPPELEQIDMAAGQLFNRLLTQSCRKEMAMAMRHEGTLAMQQSFSVLGQVASMEMATSPNVQTRMGAFAKHLDQAALEAVGRESAAMELPSAVAPLPPAAAAAPK